MSQAKNNEVLLQADKPPPPKPIPVPKQEVICAILNKKEYKNTGFQNQIKSEAEIRYFYNRL